MQPHTFVAATSLSLFLAGYDKFCANGDDFILTKIGLDKSKSNCIHDTPNIKLKKNSATFWFFLFIYLILHLW